MSIEFRLQCLAYLRILSTKTPFCIQQRTTIYVRVTVSVATTQDREIPTVKYQ